jgi:hypothetical protein
MLCYSAVRAVAYGNCKHARCGRGHYGLHISSAVSDTELHSCTSVDNLLLLYDYTTVVCALPAAHCAEV